MSKKKEPKSIKEITEEIKKEATLEQITQEAKDSPEENITKLAIELEEPDFDFNDFYNVGEKLYYLRVHPNLQEINIEECKVRSIYPRTIILLLKKGNCLCVGYKDRNNIYIKRQLAVDAYSLVKIEEKETVEE